MAQITILNDMVSQDFAASLDIQKSWGIQVLDLRQNIFGKNLAGLTIDEAKAAAEQIAERDMSVYCLSSGIFLNDIELGREAFANRYDAEIEHIIQLAEVLKPKVVRLLSARSSKRDAYLDSVEHMEANHPWVIPMYREAVDRIHSAGLQVTIENEAKKCIWSKPNEIIGFFRELNRPDKVSFTFDVQNIWFEGTFPTMDVYRELRPLMGYYHLKGGQTGESGDKLVWQSALDDASWPVAELTKQVLADKATEVICLNPSHGEVKPGYDYNNLDKRNYDYVKNIIDSMNEDGSS
ncbi:sugar phosphate isomerase/epimerase [Paenibacillus sp. PAMC21692]|uniref:sugar phosphate isomerase/epimerase n=1 Tax=Paenibacillus sp. PAMC21692 TaxID=2762320 RepID=UPI0021C3A5C9|nr:sugar phosphate isomerase/epimerase [Paenibacillus sp. PAMC21692]